MFFFWLNAQLFVLLGIVLLIGVTGWFRVLLLSSLRLHLWRHFVIFGKWVFVSLNKVLKSHSHSILYRAIVFIRPFWILYSFFLQGFPWVDIIHQVCRCVFFFVPLCQGCCFKKLTVDECRAHQCMVPRPQAVRAFGLFPDVFEPCAL